MPIISIKDIEEARENIKGIVNKTDLIYDYTTSHDFKSNVFLKLENTQIVKSFKIRGALNAIKHLTNDQKKAGIICASAGNHAQGVAYSATQLGIHSVVVMPNQTPLAKVQATMNFGADVVFGPTPFFDDANKLSMELAKENGYTLIPPYDDKYVIAGQGTIGLEILEQNPQIDLVIVQIGGGGLIGGITTAIKAIKPTCEIIGVQTENFPAAYNIFKNTELKTKNLYAPSYADGIQVKYPSQMAMDIVKKHVKDVVTVTNEEVENAILYLAEKNKIIAEGAGATGMAAILAKKINIEGRNVAIIISGGNIDIDKFLSASFNSLTRQKRRVGFEFLYSNERYKELMKLVNDCSGRLYDANGTPLSLTNIDFVKNKTYDLSFYSQNVVKTYDFLQKLKDIK